MDPWPWAQLAGGLVLAWLWMAIDAWRNGKTPHESWEIAGRVLMLLAFVNPIWGLFSQNWWVYTAHSLLPAWLAFAVALKLAEWHSTQTRQQIAAGLMGFVAVMCVWVGLVPAVGVVRGAWWAVRWVMG
jgi:hypothetical protein